VGSADPMSTSADTVLVPNHTGCPSTQDAPLRIHPARKRHLYHTRYRNHTRYFTRAKRLTSPSTGPSFAYSNGASLPPSPPAVRRAASLSSFSLLPCSPLSHQRITSLPKNHQPSKESPAFQRITSLPKNHQPSNSGLGSCARPWRQSSKCRCGPLVISPEFPLMAIASCCRTRSPTRLTSRWLCL